MSHDELPEPVAEWNDALRRIEIDIIKAEQSALVASGLVNETARKRYQELTRRMALISSVSSRQVR